MCAQVAHFLAISARANEARRFVDQEIIPGLCCCRRDGAARRRLTASSAVCHPSVIQESLAMAYYSYVSYLSRVRLPAHLNR